MDGWSEGGPSTKLNEQVRFDGITHVSRDFMLCNTRAASLADHEAALGRRISGSF